MNAQELFTNLWKDYTDKNPHAKKVYDLFIAQGEEVLNDHIAFRTFNIDKVNIEVLAKHFKAAGYVEKGEYVFQEKHLFAKHYEIPGDLTAPRVFISQLMIDDFSEELQTIIHDIVSKIPQEKLDTPEVLWAGKLWGDITWENYQKLRNESEYAGWLYVNGFTVNHFTVSVTHLKKLNDIYVVNEFLKQNGFLINDAGGEVQGTPAELLEQSSIKAGLKIVSFAEGNHEVPACYYEFAKRYPEADGKLYSGFIAKSADKIFQSTDYYTNQS